MTEKFQYGDYDLFAENPAAISEIASKFDAAEVHQLAEHTFKTVDALLAGYPDGLGTYALGAVVAATLTHEGGSSTEPNLDRLAPDHMVWLMFRHGFQSMLAAFIQEQLEKEHVDD